MRFETLFAALAATSPVFAATTVALDQAFVAAATLNYNWHVTDWKAGCSTGDCKYGALEVSCRSWARC